MGEHSVKIFAFPKTRVCIDCKKRKPLNENYFHKQKPPRIPKRMPDYRTDCKKCQNKKSKDAYYKRTTKAQRAAYIRNYFRVIRGIFPNKYRVAA